MHERQQAEGRRLYALHALELMQQQAREGSMASDALYVARSTLHSAAGIEAARRALSALRPTSVTLTALLMLTWVGYPLEDELQGAALPLLAAAACAFTELD